MLLLTVAERTRDQNRPLAYIDIETLRDNPYPDVLIRLLMELVTALDENLGKASGISPRRSARKARRGLRGLRKRLDTLLTDPQEAIHNLTQSTRRIRGKQAQAEAKAGAASHGVGASAGVGTDRAITDERTDEIQAQFTRTKLEGLRAETIEFRAALELALAATGNRGAVVILDDFYFIRREDQPDVLSYLHSVVKNLGIWLKIGAVDHRLNAFEDGDPPRGLQFTQDAGRVAMDVTLAHFDHTRAFLEGILSDICNLAAIDMAKLVTEGARTRLLVASGGVPRDYLNLVQASLAKAAQRTGEPNRLQNKINAEDVTLSLPDFFAQRETDLFVDAGPEDVDRLRKRFDDVLDFCLNLRSENVFLVEARHLREEAWGRDISALSDLRFFHRLGNLTVKSSEAGFTGKRFEAFVLDLSSYASTRVRGTKEIEFWTPDGYQELRGARHVYSPVIADDLHREVIKAAKKPTPAPPQVVGQASIFDQIVGPKDDSKDGS